MADFAYERYVQELIQKQEKAASAAFKRCKDGLASAGYYTLENQEKKIEYLCSPNGIVVLEEASKEKINFAQLSQLLGFSQKELHQIAREHDEVYDAIDRGQAKQFDGVEEALYKSAKGFTVNEKTEFESTDDRGRTTKNVQHRQKYIQPSVLAQQYILNNKRQMEYYDRQIQAAQEKNTVHLVIEYVDAESEIERDRDDE